MSDATEKYILTINAGSSSIKFALYSSALSPVCKFHGVIDRIGLSGAALRVVDATGKETVTEMSIAGHTEAIAILESFLVERVDMSAVVAIGHRIVHGMDRTEHAVLTPELISQLKALRPLDPEHMPIELEVVESFIKKFPLLPQVACFDTVFHANMPLVAHLLSIPRKFYAQGLRRYGFHGLSCTYIMEELSRLDPERAKGNVIIAHLGNGASVTAVKAGQSIDTSMGFTPAGGIPMSSRTGDIDPGVIEFLLREKSIAPEELGKMINRESGLLGISETSSDMHDLLDHMAEDLRAKEAVDLFCYEVKKRIGAYAAALGGVETIIFTGGMGEHAPRIRTRVCAGLEFLGVFLEEASNEASASIISFATAPVTVRVMRTDEESVIARTTAKFIIQ